MNKLCLSTYLTVLNFYKLSHNSGQSKILNALISCICTNPEPIDAQRVTHIKQGTRNIPSFIMDEIREKNYSSPHYLENFKAKVEILLDPRKTIDICKTLAVIIHDDDEIPNDCIVDNVLYTKKMNLYSITNPIEFIAGVFLYVIKLDNNHTEIYAKAITKEYCINAISEYDSNINCYKSPSDSFSIIMDSDIPAQAKAFCRKHENSINLLPLCQIANIVNPRHNHVNKMYSEYCNCSDILKEQIMKEIECPMLEVADKFELYRYLSYFGDDVERIGLSASNHVYMFRQYVVKSLSFEKMEPLTPSPNIFPIVPSKFMPERKTSVLSQFIGDYLFYKDSEHALPVPFDWMFSNLDLANCDCADLIFWLNIFIISACYDIPQALGLTPTIDTSLVIPNLEDTKTIEDIHFLALLVLYSTYKNMNRENL